MTMWSNGSSFNLAASIKNVSALVEEVLVVCPGAVQNPPNTTQPQRSQPPSAKHDLSHEHSAVKMETTLPSLAAKRSGRLSSPTRAL